MGTGGVLITDSADTTVVPERNVLLNSSSGKRWLGRWIQFFVASYDLGPT